MISDIRTKNIKRIARETRDKITELEDKLEELFEMLDPIML